ncbi:VOC family protein [Pseudomonas sp. M30-35]|uniref:VOC family protein n=1 Tax=Pseudomonas sp. M30-35 TaxID=1981174 RepID=UPI000B3D4757|nr:VOC family protein [Pseudomonas sp. M30-35]ARU87963.1 glyoxalase/bleomycin resistance/extradiol dioxygenase family protein [Pseudomonas sp. M30-35]
MQPQPLIAVADVPASSLWYQQLLACKSAHGGAEYEQLVNSQGQMILQLHAWDAHNHRYLGDSSIASRGNGMLLWFLVNDFAAALVRIAALQIKVLQGPLLNRNAQHREVWLRDPDGYTVVLAGQHGEL